MKVLLVHKFFHRQGGAEVFLFELDRLLTGAGHEVAHFSTLDERNEPSEWEDYFVSAPRYRDASFLAKLRDIPKTIYNGDAAKSFGKLLDDFKPDIVHAISVYTHISPSIFVEASKREVPVVLSCVDYKIFCTNYKMFHHGQICYACKGGKYWNPIIKRCCHNSLALSTVAALEAATQDLLGLYRNNVSRFLFVCDFMAQMAKETHLAESQTGVLRLPFNATDYSASTQDDGFLLYFGRLVEEKGADIAVKAMEYLPDAKLKVVGDGPEEHALRQLAKDRQLDNVEFLGPLWDADLYKILARARAVVVPSRWHEPFPYVIAQSFAMGKCIIGTRRGGIPEFVGDDERGITFEPEDIDDTVAALGKLVADAELARELGQAAKVWADANLNEKVYAETLLDHYRKAIA